VLEGLWEANFPNIPNIPGIRNGGKFVAVGPHPYRHPRGTRPSAPGEGNETSIPAV
jgi:hypothetical protein